MATEKRARKKQFRDESLARRKSQENRRRLTIAGLIAAAVVVIVGMALVSTGGDDEGASTAAPGECDESPQTLDSGVVIEDMECGEGEEAERGDLLTVHYTGTLEDGTKFDSSLDRGQPFELRLGAGMVIPGWEEGLPGMRVGGTRQLTIPPELGYGEAGSPPDIPPNSTLVFEIELLEVQKDG
ncbi:MAG: FKBP-type peptidyl-prolyl cis-trans isomerase [Actinomycetota bacterium]